MLWAFVGRSEGWCWAGTLSVRSKWHFLVVGRLESKESPSIRTAAAHLKVLDNPRGPGTPGSGSRRTRSYPNDPQRPPY
jgi:hypothetical protein